MLMEWIALILAMALILALVFFTNWVIMLFRKKAKKIYHEAQIRAGGEFDIDVVGESHYQDNLEIVASESGRGWDDDLQAWVVPEPDNPHDKNACAIYIDDLKVGYLRRQNAKEFKELIKLLDLDKYSKIGVKARLVGGTNNKPSFGVILDMPALDSLD